MKLSHRQTDISLKANEIHSRFKTIYHELRDKSKPIQNKSPLQQ